MIEIIKLVPYIIIILSSGIVGYIIGNGKGYKTGFKVCKNIDDVFMKKMSSLERDI